MFELSLVIATIVSRIDHNKILGYRVATISDCKICALRDMDLKYLISILNLNKMFLQNVSYNNNMLYGTQGELDRLPKINEFGVLVSDNNNSTIVYKVRDSGFMLINSTGSLLGFFTPDEIVELIKEKRISGLSNGKIVVRNGYDYIYALRGNFLELNMRN